MTEPPFPEVTEVKGDVLSASKGYRKPESCFETPKSSEEHPGIGCSRDKAHKVLSDQRWAEMGVCSKLHLRLHFRHAVIGNMSAVSRGEQTGKSSVAPACKRASWEPVQMLIPASENHQHLLMCTVAFAKCFFGRSRTGCVILIYSVAEEYSESSCIWSLVSVLHLSLIKAHGCVTWAYSSFWVWSYKSTQLSEAWGPCSYVRKGQSWWLWATKNSFTMTETEKKCHLKKQLSSQDWWILSRKCLCIISCGGLALAASHGLTQLLDYSPLSRTGEEIGNDRSVGQIERKRGRWLSNYHHGQNRLTLWNVYCQLNI